MKKLPTSKKKHAHLRRKRTADWDESRRQMEERHRLADEAADEYLKDLLSPKSRFIRWIKKQIQRIKLCLSKKIALGRFAEKT